MIQTQGSARPLILHPSVEQYKVTFAARRRRSAALLLLFAGAMFAYVGAAYSFSHGNVAVIGIGVVIIAVLGGSFFAYDLLYLARLSLETEHGMLIRRGFPFRRFSLGLGTLSAIERR